MLKSNNELSHNISICLARYYLKIIVSKVVIFFKAVRTFSTKSKISGKEVKSNLKYSLGFTLAEILIVIGIIGIIAEETIPNLVENYQKEMTVTELRKAYSTMSQVFESATADNGPIETWDWDNSDITTIVETYILPYLSIMKNCKLSDTDECSSKTKFWLNGKSFTNGEWGTNDSYTILLQNGSQYIFSYFTNSNCFDIMVDLNGDKKPNIAGKDVFFMRLSRSGYSYLNNNNKLFFIDPSASRNSLINSSLYGCNKTASLSPGLYCGALIQYDGWKISDDYPW